MNTYEYRFYFKNGDIVTCPSYNTEETLTRLGLLFTRCESGQCTTIIQVKLSINDNKFRIVKNNRI